MEIKKALDGCALKLMIIHGKTNLIFHAREIPMEAKLYSLRRTVRQQPFVLAVFVTFCSQKNSGCPRQCLALGSMNILTVPPAIYCLF